MGSITTPKAKTKPRFFYGWWVVAASFLILVTSSGVGIYSRSVFFTAMFTDLGWGRGELALAMSVGTVVAAMFSPVIGAWVDRHGASRLIAVSALFSGLITIATSRITLLWHAYAIFIAYAFTMVGMMFIPIQVTVSHWFHKKRGRAMGIAMAGVGMGGFVFGPLAASLIGSIGWRNAWVVLGVIIWVTVIPPALLMMKLRPEPLGLAPDGEAPAEELPSPDKETGQPLPRGNEWTARRALREPVFWMLVAVWFLFYAGLDGVMAHSFAMFTDKGMAALTAGTLVGLTGLFSLVGKLVLGYLCERVAVRYVMGSALAVFALSVIMLRIGPAWVVWPFVMLYGFSMGGTAGIQPLLAIGCFGVSAVGVILGLLELFASFSYLFASPLTGYSYDTTGSYNLALTVIAGVLGLAAALAFLARPPVRKTDESASRVGS